MEQVFLEQIIIDSARRLLNNTTFDNTNSSRNGSSTSNSTNGYNADSEEDALRQTLRTYGSVFLSVWFLFCGLQQLFPRLFAVRSWSEPIKCDLAQLHYGLFSWMWKVHWVHDEDIQDQCGMDTLCFFRMLRFGQKLALMGCLNAIWLLPLYRVATNAPPVATTFATKPLSTISIVHVPAGSKRLVGTVVAAYILFLYAMWLVVKEFEWYIRFRHRFLEKRMARNYAVYVSGIPQQYRSSKGLADYFRRCCARQDDVLEACCTLNIPQLENQVARCQQLRDKLEHAMALQQLQTASSSSNGKCCSRPCRLLQNADSIPALQEELDALVAEIRIAASRLMRDASEGRLQPTQGITTDEGSSEFGTARSAASESIFAPIDDNTNGSRSSALDRPDLEQPLRNYGTGSSDVTRGCDPIAEQDMDSKSFEKAQLEETTPILKALNSALSEIQPDKLKQHLQQAGEYGINQVIKVSSHGVEQVRLAGECGVENVLHFAELGSNLVGTAVDTAVTIVVGHEEGTPREAGFVLFTKLYAVHSALQMIHHPMPQVMQVHEAPAPNEIIWRNVGLPVRAQRLGGYLSFVATVVLCFFWSIPVAFISSLTQVSSLEQLIPFLKRWLEKFPGLANLLAQLAPLLLYLLNNLLLPLLLREFSKLEGHIGKSDLQASVFVKMSAFMIIQTFFVSAISGSIAATLSDILDNPKKVIDLLANSLPVQSSYFLQIILVFTFTSLAFTMLRVSPLIQALLRTMVGPRLTEKERQQTWLFLHPLANPPEFFHGQYTAPFVTGYMVIFVYATITPITSCFLLACFIFIDSVYRLEFFRNFPAVSDSGGKMWKGFINVILVCMVFAQLTLVGFLALKKAAAAVPLMLPLIIITILFFVFINDKHFKVATTLPTSNCLSRDISNEEQGLEDFSFLLGKYLQPALQHHDDAQAVVEGSNSPSASAVQEMP